MGETEQDLIMKLCGILCDLKYTGINFLYCFSVWFVFVCVCGSNHLHACFYYIVMTFL